MASQTQPITTTDVLNYAGEAFALGATLGKSPIISEAGLRNGFKVAGSTLFPMGNFFTGDAPAQDGVTEDDSIGAGTNTSYTPAQVTQNMQIFDKRWIRSFAASAFEPEQSGVNTTQPPQTISTSLATQEDMHVKQAMADWEFSGLYGTSQVWTDASTTGAMGGLLTAVQAGSETAAADVALSLTLIDTEIARMAAAGAEFEDIWVVSNAFQNQALNKLFGNPIMSQTTAGTNIQTIMLPVAGPVKVLYSAAMAADDLAFIDLAHFSPVFGIPKVKSLPGLGAGINVVDLALTTAGERQMLYMLASVDYDNIAYHGMISGLATS